MRYTPEEKEKLFEKVIGQVKNGKPIRQLLGTSGYPGAGTFYKWLDEDEDFQKRYVRATDIRAAAIFEEIIEIADDSTHDELITEKGVFFNREFAARSKIRIDARIWCLSKMKPSKYGSKLDVTTDGEKINIPAITGMVIKNEIAEELPNDDDLL